MLASPRRRRRFGWSALALAVLAGGAGAIALMPRGEGAPPDVLRPAPPLPVEREVRLTASMRDGIDATISRFVPAAVGRRDPALAWRLAGPALRAGGSRAEWLRGSLPVFPFPYRDTRFPDWKPLYTYHDRVGFDLLLQPRRGAKKGPIAVKVEMVRGRTRWLVDSWYPTAVWSAPDERPWIAGPPDFAAGGYTSEWYNHEPTTQGRLDPAWLLVPAGILGLVIAAPLALFGAARLRRRAST
jgi:hypothetical protein